MSRLLRKSLAMIAALALLLPAGWCCLPAVGGEAPAARVRTCCGHAQPPRHSAPHLPQNSREDCCCVRDAVKASVGSAAAYPLSDAAIFDEAAYGALCPRCVSLADTVSAGDAAGPPLHVLQCVWRC